MLAYTRRSTGRYRCTVSRQPKQMCSNFRVIVFISWRHGIMAMAADAMGASASARELMLLHKSVLRREAHLCPTSNVPLHTRHLQHPTCSPFDLTSCNIRVTKLPLGKGCPSLPSIRTLFKDPPVNICVTGVSC